MALAIPTVLYFLLGESEKLLMLFAPMASKVAAKELKVCIVFNSSCPHFNLVIFCHPKVWINIVTTLLVKLVALKVDILDQWIFSLPIIYKFHWSLIKRKVPAVVFMSQRHDILKSHHFIKPGA
jgi:hypothetical protein